MSAWRVWWLFGIPVGLLTSALTMLGELARDRDMNASGDALDVLKVLVYAAWLIAAWRCTATMQTTPWRIGARLAVLLGIVVVSLTA